MIRNLGHNGFSGPIPNEIERLTKLESLIMNYNTFNGQFPSSMAPNALGYCYMTPNQFQSCPDQSIIANPQSLAFQCSVDCIVKSKKKKSAASMQSPTNSHIMLFFFAFFAMFM